MKKNVLPHRSLVLWQLRAAAITFLAAFLLTLLLSDFHFWYRLSLMLTGILFLFFFIHFLFIRFLFHSITFCRNRRSFLLQYIYG